MGSSTARKASVTALTQALMPLASWADNARDWQNTPTDLNLLGPLLRDSVRAVRIIAARNVQGAARNGLGAYQGAWDSAIAEYETVQLSLAERAESNLNLAMLYQASGRNAEVEPKLRAALLCDPDFFPAVVTLAQWLEASGRSAEAMALLSDTIKAHPQTALLQHSQGLALIRAGQPKQAMSALQQAVTLEPDNAQYRYVLAVALHQNGQVGPACEHMEELLKRQPAFRDARLALISFTSTAARSPRHRRCCRHGKRSTLRTWC